MIYLLKMVIFQFANCLLQEAIYIPWEFMKFFISWWLNHVKPALFHEILKFFSIDYQRLFLTCLSPVPGSCQHDGRCRGPESSAAACRRGKLEIRAPRAIWRYNFLFWICEAAEGRPCRDPEVFGAHGISWGYTDL